MISPAIEDPKPKRWTSEEFYRLVAKGFFVEKRVELIEGELVEMPAQTNWHAMTVKLLEEALEQAFGPNYWVRAQMPLDLTPHSTPDPDLAVVEGNVRRHDPKKNPSSAQLIVEVSDTTYHYDRDTKGSLYALAGIVDYWIVNRAKKRIEVYREPAKDRKKAYGWGYKKSGSFASRDTIAPLALPGVDIACGELLI